MPATLDATDQRHGLHKIVRRLLQTLPQHPAWPAYLARSARARAHYDAGTRILARLEAGEAIPLEAIAREADALARVSARLRNYAETGLTRDG